MNTQIVPESAPFSPAQRAWLNGLLTEALGLNGGAPLVPDNAVAPIAAAPVVAPVVAPISVAENSNELPSAPARTGTPADARGEADATRKRTLAYDRANPFPAAILEIRPLNRKDSEKDVRAVALDLKGSGLTYEVGDALGVYPENDAELVESILEILGATGEEPVITPEGSIIPARLALSKAYVINQCNEELLEHLAHIAADPAETSRLAALAADDAEDFLHGRDVLDMLRDFPSTMPTSRDDIGDIINSLAPLRPRLYSIASSLKAHNEQVHLTVGVVRFSRQDSDRMLKGVASTFLTERMQPGHKVGVFVQKAHAFGLPHDDATPIIMVGPGTGIAPFRAFLQERAAKGASGKNWLFFGDQRCDSDFLYRQELEAYVQSGVLTRLDTAFSRDQAEKIYVQQRMLENAAQLWAWLEEGAHFYVCGNAKRMARDVDKALQQIIAAQGKLDPAAAKSYLANLAKTNRYQRDVY